MRFGGLKMGDAKIDFRAIIIIFILLLILPVSLQLLAAVATGIMLNVFDIDAFRFGYYPRENLMFIYVMVFGTTTISFIANGILLRKISRGQPEKEALVSSIIPGFLYGSLLYGGIVLIYGYFSILVNLLLWIFLIAFCYVGIYV